MNRKNQSSQKITALYCRLSLEDGRENESMSISNQKLMLKDYAEKNGMFQYEYYVDDGYTGRNFNRPSFQRMIADIQAGKIGCVITKDLSRLGRNYIEAGSYIEIFFPKHNVRYIAITDGVDSLTRQEMDITPFKNILNDMYSRDISKKVLAGRMTRSQQALDSVAGFALLHRGSVAAVVGVYLPHRNVRVESDVTLNHDLGRLRGQITGNGRVLGVGGKGAHAHGGGHGQQRGSSGGAAGSILVQQSHNSILL